MLTEWVYVFVGHCKLNLHAVLTQEVYILDVFAASEPYFLSICNLT